MDFNKSYLLRGYKKRTTRLAILGQTVTKSYCISLSGMCN